ncbi:hypothetical protein CERSUDRAFT_60698, partial [Gelatoporia subvermispora B]
LGRMSSQAQEATETQSKWDHLYSHLRGKPYDADSWLKLLDVAEGSGDIEKLKKAYEALLEAYPHTPSVQIAYLRHCMETSDLHNHVEALFKRFLYHSPFVELWKLYLAYVRRRLNTGPNARDTMRKCYELAINRVGQDKDSAEIWIEYIRILKSVEATTTWTQQHTVDALRKAYRRAVQIPMDDVEKLWEEYCAFESAQNKYTAKEFLSDLQEGHTRARATLAQLQEHLAALRPSSPPSKQARPRIRLPRQQPFNADERAFAAHWRAYLKWEESNPLGLEEKDKASLIARIESAYRKAVVRRRFFPDIWQYRFMAYTWTNKIGKTQEAIALLKAGIEANPNSFVLNFAYVEALEMQENYEEVHSVFNNFLEALREDLQTLEQRFLSQCWSNSLPSDNKNLNPKELADRRTEYGVVWTVYMRFALRAEGVESNRAVFTRARKDYWTPWGVYEAAALMEYHCGKNDGVASRIFELGLAKFSDDITFVTRYLSFLISVNDANNARAVFERAIGMFPADCARPLWELWARHEYQFGTLATAHKIERQMSEVYPNGECLPNRQINNSLFFIRFSFKALRTTAPISGVRRYRCP